MRICIKLLFRAAAGLYRERVGIVLLGESRQVKAVAGLYRGHVGTALQGELHQG